MTSREDEFLARLRATFAIEAREHLHAMATGLLELEKSPDADARARSVEIVFRAAHSLKGAARAVDFTDIESRCQSLEEMFAAWKHQPTVPPREVLDAAHRTLNEIGAAIGMSGSPEAIAESDGVPAVAATAERVMAPDETVRISVTKLDRRVLQAEEMLAAKLTVGQHADDLRALTTRFEPWKKAWAAVEPNVHALRSTVERQAVPPAATTMSTVLQFLEWNRDYVKALEGSVSALSGRAAHDREAIGRLVDEVLDESKKLLLLPFAAFVAPFPKLVRDLCRDQGKEADLMLLGEEIETDKRILDEMKAPVIHLLRNCVDHGIEPPQERLRLGKPARGTISLAASARNGNKVEIRVSDDGAGIDAEKVKMSAIVHGVLSADNATAFEAAEAGRLIFEPAVSTSPTVTKVSGRGLGLAIVREKAEKLGGTVSVETEPGRGTTFSIVVPSTLATFRGILVEAAQQVFVVPTLHVERVTRVKADDIRSVEGRDTVSLNGRAVPLVRLADVLELPDAQTPGDARADILILVLGTGDQCVAFRMDLAHDEQEVLVKPLRRPLIRVRNVAGATVLGSGQVVPILNVSDLLKSARRTGGTAAGPGAALRRPPAASKNVLVVEDSITSRMLIKGILESAGYAVRTAVDGLEAFTMLRAERFDLVVSDVEMPRLNGFDLTARLRADRKLADLPVILVTALDKREDRERGIDVGANAYIVKSRFDQSDLLDAVRRLV